MDKNIDWLNEQKIIRTIKALEKNNMNGYLVKDNNELKAKVEELINEGDTVAFGGSMTLFESGIMDYLKSGKYNLLDRNVEGISREEVQKIYRDAFFADDYFVSTNAITVNGEIYNVDGNGNRVAAMLFGPKKVIIICGVNKIVEDLNSAIARCEQISSPANAKRLSRETPCTKLGYCMDCSSEQRICNEYTIIKRQSIKGRIHVIFINKELGY